MKFERNNKAIPIPKEILDKMPQNNKQEISIPQKIVSGVPAKLGEEKILGLSKFREDMKQDGRVVLPWLKLVQSMSDDFTQDNIQPGHFRNSLTGEDFGPIVEIFPVAIYHWRRLFNDRIVSCSSNDAITGVGDPGGICKACPLSKWQVIRANGETEDIPNIRTFRTKKDEQLISAKCSEQFVFPSIILSSEWKVPGVLVFHKTYLNEGLRLYSLIEWSPPDSVYQVKSEKTTNDKGTWFVPVVKMSRKLKEDEMNSVLSFRENLQTSTVEVSEEVTD